MNIFNTKLKPIYIVILLLAGIGYTAESYAGGWPTRKGRLLLSPSVNYFFANKYWDRGGNVTSYPDNGNFTSVGLYLYSEYGLTKRLTLVGTAPFINNTFKGDGYKFSATGLGDVEVGARYYIGNIKYKYYFAVQGMGIIPTYRNTPSRFLGYEAAGADVRLIGSCSGKLGSKSYYFNLEGGVRQYFTNAGPFQVRGFTTFGYNFAKKHQATISASGILSQSEDTRFDRNLVNNKDFSYLQGTLSYGYSIKKDLIVFAGVNQFLAGKNTGIGTNASLSLVVRM